MSTVCQFGWIGSRLGEFEGGRAWIFSLLMGGPVTPARPTGFHQFLVPILRGAVRLFEPAVFPGNEIGPPLASPVEGADPVIIIHGIGDTAFGGQDMAASLRRDGFTVFTPTMPESGFYDAVACAEYLRNYIELVKKRTGAKHVNIVAHSQGGIIARAYIKWFGGEASVSSLTTMGSPHHGLEKYGPFSDAQMGAALLQGLIPPGITQMRSGGEFIRQLNDGDETPGAVQYVSIYSRDHDGIVSPQSSHLDGAKNVVLTADQRPGGLRGPSHFGINHTSVEAYVAVRDALIAAPRDASMHASSGARRRRPARSHSRSSRA